METICPSTHLNKSAKKHKQSDSIQPQHSNTQRAVLASGNDRKKRSIICIICYFTPLHDSKAKCDMYYSLIVVYIYVKVPNT